MAYRESLLESLGNGVPVYLYASRCIVSRYSARVCLFYKNEKNSGLYSNSPLFLLHSLVLRFFLPFSVRTKPSADTPARSLARARACTCTRTRRCARASERVIRLRRESAETFGSFASPLSLPLPLSFFLSPLPSLFRFTSNLSSLPLHSCPSFSLSHLSFYLSAFHLFISLAVVITLSFSLFHHASSSPLTYACVCVYVRMNQHT